MPSDIPAQPTPEMEDVDAFRERARAWLAARMKPLPPGEWEIPNRDTDEGVQHARDLMAKLFDAGFSGICFPKEYGGQGLSVAHMRAWSEEAQRYEMPTKFNIPTLTILLPTLLDYGTEAQKQEHIPKTLRGEEMWVQFLSEPTGGSDLAGALTKATRDGDVYVLSGSKIWSSGAYRADYALCLCRTNWDVQKHRGLSVLLVKIHQPGIQVEQIRQINGSMEFCQEFFDDVPIPADQLVGEEDDGWTVVSRLLQHERSAVGNGSAFGVIMQLGARRTRGETTDPLVDITKQLGLGADPTTRQLVAEGRVLSLVQPALVDRVGTGIRAGKLPGPSSALMKLANATTGIARAELAVKIAGSAAAAWVEPGPASQQAGVFLSRQTAALAGGSNEIQRNIISERVLGMPREFAPDKDAAFKDVKRNTIPTRKP
ncbi:MAG: acyl-CoA dehydrogenase family protein [Acidobacteria bacterium]|nr:acyl-CoA dehydrogenase family protein [Acidobacteriota bacterium]